MRNIITFSCPISSKNCKFLSEVGFNALLLLAGSIVIKLKVLTLSVRLEDNNSDQPRLKELIIVFIILIYMLPECENFTKRVSLCMLERDES